MARFLEEFHLSHMNFSELLTKVNTRLQELYTNSQTDTESGGVEIKDHLILLEVKHPLEWQAWLNGQTHLLKFQALAKKVQDKMINQKMTYTIVPELNYLFLKDKTGVVVKEINLAVIDALLQKHLGLDSSHEHFYVVKSLMVKNHRMEVLALTEVLN